jgi:hypothetical protein
VDVLSAPPFREASTSFRRLSAMISESVDRRGLERHDQGHSLPDTQIEERSLRNGRDERHSVNVHDDFMVNA